MQISEVKKITEKTGNLMNTVSLVLYGFELYMCSSDNEDLLKRFHTGLKEDLITKSDFSHSIFDLKITPLKETSDIILLKLLGYAKIFKEESNEIFKFNSFHEFFGNWLNQYCLNIKDVKKEEIFIMSGGVLKTPMEIV